MEKRERGISVSQLHLGQTDNFYMYYLFLGDGCVPILSPE